MTLLIVSLELIGNNISSFTTELIVIVPMAYPKGKPRELKHGYNEYITYEKLKPDVLDRQISSGMSLALMLFTDTYAQFSFVSFCYYCR